MKKIEFRQPVEIMSALQLRDMPLQEMLDQIDRQEAQASNICLLLVDL